MLGRVLVWGDGEYFTYCLLFWLGEKLGLGSGSYSLSSWSLGFLLFCMQVNGLDTIRVPMSVVNFEKPKTKRYKRWLAQQAAKEAAPTSSQTIWTCSPSEVGKQNLRHSGAEMSHLWPDMEFETIRGHQTNLHMYVEFCIFVISIFDYYHLSPYRGSPAQEIPSCRYDKVNVHRSKTA